MTSFFFSSNLIGFRMLLTDDSLSRIRDLLNTKFLTGHIFLKLVKFSLQNLNVLQIEAEFFGRNKCLFVIDPKEYFVTLPHKLDQNQGLLQTQALFRQFCQK